MLELTSRNLKGFAELLGPGAGGDEHGEVGLLDHLVDGGLGARLEAGIFNVLTLNSGDSVMVISILWSSSSSLGLPWRATAICSWVRVPDLLLT